MTPRLLILAGFALLAGCVAQPVSKPAAPVVTPKPAPIVNGQTEKDATVVGAADRIDGIVQGEAVAAPVRVETDTIRAAVAANPASDVKALAAQFEEAIKLLREQLAASDKRAKQLDAQIESLRDAEMKAQARDLRYAAFGLLAFAGLLGWAKQTMWSAASAIGALLCFGVAQIISQPWFMPACAVAVALGLAAFGWAAVHAYRKHELATKVEKEAAKLKATLVRVVPAVDSAIDEVGEAGAKIKDKLRAAMTGKAGTEAKATIHEIRAAAKLTETPTQ